MTYQIKFSNVAAKFFRKLPAAIQERVKERLKLATENPLRYREHYEGDYHKIRIGDIRTLVDVDHAQKILWMRVPDKRRQIYEQRWYGRMVIRLYPCKTVVFSTTIVIN